MFLFQCWVWNNEPYVYWADIYRCDSFPETFDSGFCLHLPVLHWDSPILQEEPEADPLFLPSTIPFSDYAIRVYPCIHGSTFLLVLVFFNPNI